ncbi:ABC transporter substrate-binding protein [Pectobacterium brasiliense]|uniref:ABC transporter substrate-binding protein n=1 Tax=Pectobacterium brasiliense TaxID=180957 RepID=UPI000C1C79D3|nr:ABC transporter substrate-binding protein [Pectobacterium brasiliense]ATV43251.1 alkanesulfonate-binding protein [Pectobacterium brasiliense]MCA6982701.1 ABC transporter substrate-binding protein [Pectobacterium brasiliense]MCH4992257.1 ABC transporter substrate-binding protein [Pectobacterium brasiliense]
MQQTTLLITASPITASSRWRRGMKVLSTALLMGAALVSTVQANDAAPQDAQKPTEIRIGLPDQSAGSKPFIRGPLGLAHIRQQLEKEFEPQGIKIQWSFFKGAGPAVNEALANKQLDVVYLGDLAAIIGRSGSLPTRVLVGSRGSNSYLAATPESGIQRIEDLRGKRIAVYKGTADQLSFERAIKSVGLNERDVRVINLDWTAGKAALAARRVDAVWGGVSLLALRKQGINIVTTSRALGWPNTTQAAVLATQDFIDRYPGTTQQLVNVLVDNAQWIGDAQHLPEYTALMAEQSQIPQAIFQEELKVEDLPFQSSPRLDPFLLSSLQDSIERAKAAGLIRNTFSASDWFAGQFVDRALKAKGLESNWAVYDASGNPTK